MQVNIDSVLTICQLFFCYQGKPLFKKYIFNSSVRLYSDNAQLTSKLDKTKEFATRVRGFS